VTAWAVHVRASPGVDEDLAVDALWAAGAVAVEERTVPGGVLLVAALSDGSDPAPLVTATEGRWATEVVAVDLDAALDAWRPHARAVRVGPVTVRPPWVPRAPGPAAASVEVEIDPGRAFGGGTHVSTRQALGAVAAVMAAAPGEVRSVLDVGSGSGVLAIAALALGAGAAVAVDPDPAARAATRANAERNGVADRLTVAADLADLADLAEQADGASAGAGDGDGDPDARAGGEGADLAVANILAPVLVELAPAIVGTLRPGATLVLAGFLTGQRRRVEAAYTDRGLRTVEHGDDDGWVVLTLRR
jgi:ribosomal protein L11 methyltransferase